MEKVRRKNYQWKEAACMFEKSPLRVQDTMGLQAAGRRRQARFAASFGAVSGFAIGQLSLSIVQVSYVMHGWSALWKHWAPVGSW